MTAGHSDRRTNPANMCRGMRERTDATVLDVLARKRHRGRATIVEGDHVGDAGRLNGVIHRPGFGAGARQRLFADDMLAGLRRRDGDFSVAVVGRDDIDDVDVLTRDDLLPVVRGLFEAVTLATCLGEFLRHVDQHLAMRDRRRRPEEHRHRRIGQGVRLAHESAAYHRHI